MNSGGVLGKQEVMGWLEYLLPVKLIQSRHG